MAEQLRTSLGGPFERLQRAAHVGTLPRLVAILVAVTWLPLELFALVAWVAGRRPEPLVHDLTIHVRLLVALPIFAVAERLLVRIGGVTVRRLFDEEFVPPAAQARLRELARRTERWRQAAPAEWILAALALAGGVATLTGLVSPSGAVHAVDESRYGATRIWYGLVSLPVFQFLLWRSLYNWALWVRLLAALSRVPLRLLPAHADRRAGIGFVRMPSVVYGALLLLAASSVLCAGWAADIRARAASLESVKPLLLAFVLIGVVVTLAPLLLFLPQLVRARVDGQRRYGRLLSDYNRRFQERWIEPRERTGLLGTPDIQSLADLGTTYHESVERLQIFLLAPADCLALVAAALLPAVPLVFLEWSAADAIKKLVQLALGGAPR